MRRKNTPSYGFLIVILMLCVCLCACTIAQDIGENADIKGNENDAPTETPTLPEPKYEWNRAPMLCYEDKLYLTTLEEPLYALADESCLGIVASTVEDGQIPSEQFQTNCGYVGCEVFVCADSTDVLYIRVQTSYLPFRFDGMTAVTDTDTKTEEDDSANFIDPGAVPPLMRYDDAAYMITTWPLEVKAGLTLRFVGIVRSDVPSGGVVTKDFKSNNHCLGRQVYIDPNNKEEIYLWHDGQYWICERL